MNTKRNNNPCRKPDNKTYLVKNDLLASPAKIQLADGTSLDIKIDAFYLEHGLCAVGGWASAPLALSLEGDKMPAEQTRQENFVRSDVNIFLGAPDDAQLAFGIAGRLSHENELYLVLEFAEQNFNIKIPLAFANAETSVTPALMGALGKEIYEFLEKEERKNGLPLNYFAYSIDECLKFEDYEYGDIIALTGWLIMPESAKVLVKTESGTIYPEIFFYPRPDVAETVGKSSDFSFGDTGFFTAFRLCGEYGESFEIFVEFAGIRRKITLPENFQSLSYINFIKSLFSMAIPHTLLARASEQFLIPLLEKQQKKHIGQGKSLRRKEGAVGECVQTPSISVIVPLYGNLDLLETQILCFSEDPIFKNDAELVFVLDDPSLLEMFQLKIEELWNIYGLSCRWVAPPRNMGFSGANNIGAETARGAYLFFLNSDVFSQEPGAFSAMRDYLENNPKVGIVGCRLLDAHGSIQHAGMMFHEQRQLAIWTNLHPFMGCDPRLDPIKAPASVPAVTGACLGISKNNLNRLGGWCEEYIIGDFEDSDLCLRAMRAGLEVVYLPNVVFIHLERQTFSRLDKLAFRERLAIYNAALHQKKWRADIEKLAARYREWPGAAMSV